MDVVAKSDCHSAWHLIVKNSGRMRKKVTKIDKPKIKKLCKSMTYKAYQCPEQELYHSGYQYIISFVCQMLVKKSTLKRLSTH